MFFKSVPFWPYQVSIDGGKRRRKMFGQGKLRRAGAHLPIINQTSGGQIGRSGVRPSPQPFDALTNLTYHGNGRYYDPLLGLEVQPRQTGGSPLLPQTQNRYSYSSSSAAGCAACSQGGGEWPGSDVFGLTKDIAWEILGRRSVQTGIRQFARIRITASRTALTINNDKYIPKDVLDRFGFKHTGSGSHGRWVFESGEIDSWLAETFDESWSNRLPKGHGRGLGEIDVFGRRVEPVFSHLDDLPWWNIADFGLDFALGAGFQFLEDVNNPLLTPGQIGGRAIVAGIGGALFSGAGGYLSGLIASGLCGPGAPVCVIAFVVGGQLVGGLAWNAFQPTVFRLTKLSPAELNLRPVE